MEVFRLILYLAIIIFIIASFWKLYVKAGKPGWASIIPIYNLIVLLDIVKKPWWWIFLLLIPVVSLIIMIIIYVELAKAFGKSTGFAVGLILLPFVFIPILAFGDAQYQYNNTSKTEDTSAE